MLQSAAMVKGGAPESVRFCIGDDLIYKFLTLSDPSLIVSHAVHFFAAFADLRQ